jgi:hypothetical protein
MSTEPPGLRQDAAAKMQPAVTDRSPGMLKAQEAAEFARVLIEKYGADALAYAHDRAQRAIDVGDALALDAWHDVIAETRRLLGKIANASRASGSQKNPRVNHRPPLLELGGLVHHGEKSVGE